MARSALAPSAVEAWPLRLGWFIVSVALLNFTGWLLDYRPLQVLLPGEPSMGVVSATCFLASGMLLIRLGSRTIERVGLHLEVCLGVIYQCTLVAGALTLGRLDYEAGPLRIPSLLTALNIALVSCGMMFILYDCPLHLAQICLGAVLFISFGALIGRALGVRWMMGEWSGLSRPMPLETAILFVLLATGCLLTEDVRCSV